MRAVVLVLVGGLLAACGPSDNNEGGCKDKLIAGDLVITEVFADYAAPTGGTGADEGKEWIEIFNASDRPVELEGVVIKHGRVEAGSDVKTHTMDPITMPPGTYLTLGNSVKDLLPAYIDYGYSNDLGELFNTNGGKIDLTCGSTVIDSANYEGTKSGRSRQLTSAQPPDYTLNDDQINWCEAADTEFETNNFGTPGQDNDCRPAIAGQCSDGSGMRDTVPPMPGDLVITEVMPNPAAVSDTTGEWFEIVAKKDVDLNGLALDRAGDTTNPRPVESPDCLRLATGAHAIFAKSTDATMNGMLPAAAIRGTFTFSLVDGTMAAPADVRILYNDVVIDSITWTSARSGRSISLDPDRYDATINDEASNFCDGNATYGAGDRGTPGAMNEQCPLVAPAGMCVDGGTLRAIRKPPAGSLVITEVMINPKIESTAGQEWIEISNVGNASFDLNDLGIDQASTARVPDLIISSNCKTVMPGAFALFARSADPALNGGIMTVDATYGFALSNTGGDLQILDGTTPLDAVTWASVSATANDGKSNQLDPDSFTTAANDGVIPAAPWCLGATPYGDNTNSGTPRAANAQCP